MILSDEIKDYMKKLVAEQESLIAKYIAATGANVNDICIVERDLGDGKFGRIFYPDLKSKYEEPK